MEHFFYKSLLFFSCCFILLSLVGTMIMGIQNHAHAAHTEVNPLVTIVVDATPSPCVVTRGKLSSTQKVLSKEDIRCPAGTVLSTTNVPLTRAKAQHAAYAILPSISASHSIWLQWYKQVQQLTVAKRNALQSQPILNTCRRGGGDYYTSGYFSFLGQDSLYLFTAYHVSTDCSHVILNEERVEGYGNVGGSDYWIEFAYSNYYPFCPVGFNSYIGDNTLDIRPGVSEPSNLYAVWYIDSENLCVGGGGDIKTFSLLDSAF